MNDVDAISTYQCHLDCYNFITYSSSYLIASHETELHHVNSSARGFVFWILAAVNELISGLSRDVRPDFGTNPLIFKIAGET